MIIKKIEIDQFRTFEDVSFELGRHAYYEIHNI